MLLEAGMAKDVLFVIDTSGSMRDDKIEQARKALRNMLDSLNEEDRFTIVRFSSDVSGYSDELLSASDRNLKNAEEFVDGLEADGGTDINTALTTAPGLFTGSGSGNERPEEVIFLTDGEPTEGITDNDEILDNIRTANTGGRARARRGGKVCREQGICQD